MKRQRTTARGPLSKETTLLPPADIPTYEPDATLDTGGGGGSFPDVEGVYVHSVGPLAELAGLNGFTVASFLRETSTFTDCRPGQGVEGVFRINEAFALACWGELSRWVVGVSLAGAWRILPPSVDPYGLMREGYTHLPLSLDPKRPGQAPLDGEPVTITIDLWQVWLGFWPRFRAYVLRTDRNMGGACAAFEARVERRHEAIAAGLSPA
jgi:hypothetical protein